MSASALDQLATPRIFRFHLLHDWLPESITKETKIIYCYRNPKDVSISYFHHTKVFKQIYDVFEFDEFFKHYPSSSLWNLDRPRYELGTTSGRI